MGVECGGSGGAYVSQAPMDFFVWAERDPHAITECFNDDHFQWFVPF